MISLKRLPWLIVSASLLCLPALAEPGPARLVEDLVPGTQSFEMFIWGFQPVGSRSVFVRRDDEGRTALWVTDGTAAGTSPLGVLCPPCGAATPLGSTGSVAFYRVSGTGMAIWRTDGTPAGTFPVTSGLSAPPYWRFFESLSAGRLFFSACSAGLGCELWSTDGSAAGTAPAGEIAPGPESGEIVQLAAAGGRAFLLAAPPGEPTALWLADARGLTRLREVPEAMALLAQGKRAFFSAGRREVWTSDGTAAGTRQVAAFKPREPYSQIGLLAILGGRVYFVADHGRHGQELWSAGPRPGSQRRLTGIPGTSAGFRDLVKSGDRLVFVAAGSGGEPRLWRSLGEPGSSAPLAGCPGGCPVVVGPLAPVAPGRFVFYGQDREDGGIWTTDGTAAGTRLLQRTGLHWLAQAAPAGGRVLIQATDEYEIGELWITDGTAAGTFPAAVGGPSWSHYWGWSGPLSAGTAGGRIVFPGAVDLDNREDLLWSSDGSRAGSHPIVQGRSARGSSPSRLTPFRDGLLARTCSGDARMEMRFFQGTESTVLLSRTEPYCDLFFSEPVVLGDVAVFLRYGQDVALFGTDGTPEGTKPLLPSSPAAQPLAVVRFGDEAALSVVVPSGSAFRIEIWLTDGTPEGTRKHLELPPETDVIALTSAAGRLWFFDSVVLPPQDHYTVQPWVSDGTPAGTHPVTGTFGLSPLEKIPVPFVEAAGRVWFLYGESLETVEIWGTDGTPEGTGPAVTAESGAGVPASLTAIGDRLWFAAPRAGGPTGRLLPWASDGTDAGTELLADVDVGGDPDFALADGPPFVELDGRVFFAASDPAHGDELWSTDGTPEGTARLLDIAPGLLGSHPRGLTAWNGKLWLRARDGVHGMELWSSDGTAEGTRLVQDVNPGASWSTPWELTPTDEGLYFSAHDGEHGRELWLLPAGEVDF